MLFLALIYLVFIGLGLPDSVLGAAWPAMEKTLGVPSSAAGLISMVIAAGTIVSSLISFRVIRKIGTGRVTLISVTLTALALLGFGLASSLWMMMILAIPLGLGAGAVDSGLNEYVAEHYNARQMNWLHCFWGLGAMLGPILMSHMMAGPTGWRGGYLTIGAIQTGIALLLLFSQPAWRRRRRMIPAVTQKQAVTQRTGLFAPLRLPGAKLAVTAFFLYCGVEWGLGLWGASYLVKARSLSEEQAAFLVSMFYLGITGGRFLSGIIVQRVGNSRLIELGGGLAALGVLLILLPLPTVAAAVGLALTGLGLAPIFPGLLHQTPSLFGVEHAQAMMGLQMAVAYTGTLTLPPLIGILLERVNFNLLPVVVMLFCLLMLLCVERLVRDKGKKRAE